MMLLLFEINKKELEINTISAFSSPDHSQEDKEVQSNNDGTNGSVIGEEHLEGSMAKNLKGTTDNDQERDNNSTESTTELVETVGVQKSAVGKASEETTKDWQPFVF